MLSVSFHNPDFPDGIVFDIGGVAVPNNGSTELDANAELMFYATHRQNVKDYYKDNSYVTVSGTTELTKADRANYPGDDEEVFTETIVDPEEGDATIPETDPETGEVVKPDEEDGA